MILKKLALLAIAGAGVMTAQAAYAQTQTAAVTVKLTVNAGCTLQLNGESDGAITPELNLGSVDVYGNGKSSAPEGGATAKLGTGEITDTGTILVACSPGADLTPEVKIDGGNNADEDGGRQLAGTGAEPVLVPYTLYGGTGHTKPWVADTAQELTLDEATGKAAVYIEGVADNLGNLAPDIYSDTVTVTLSL